MICHKTLILGLLGAGVLCAQDKPAAPPPGPWSGFYQLGVAMARGNSSTTTINNAVTAERTTAHDKLGLYFNQLYATQSTAQPFGATANFAKGKAEYRRNLTPRFFLFGVTTQEHDQFQSLDLRSVYGGGAGVQLIKNDKGNWSVSAGANAMRESFSTGLKRNSGEFSTGEDSSWQVTPTLKWTQALGFFPNLTETGAYRMNFDTSAVFTVAKWVDWHVTFSDRYLSNPVPGRLKNDTVFTTGVRLSFNQKK
jgi:putative salt-induced outer membrane protein YdiY